MKAFALFLLFSNVAFSSECTESVLSVELLEIREYDSSQVRANIFKGFNLAGSARSTPLASGSDFDIGDQFQSVADRLAWSEKPENGGGLVVALDGQGAIHRDFFRQIHLGLLKSPGEYPRAYRQNCSAGNWSSFASLVCLVAIPIGILMREPAISVGALFFTAGNAIQRRILSDARVSLLSSPEGRAHRNLKRHEKIVMSPQAGAWAATGINFIFEGEAKYQDVYTWVDDGNVPHTLLVGYGPKPAATAVEAPEGVSIPE